MLARIVLSVGAVILLSSQSSLEVDAQGSDEPRGTFKHGADAGAERLHVVRAGPGLETAPAIAFNSFAWSESEREGPDHFDAFINTSSGTRKLNPRGWEGFIGSTEERLVAYGLLDRHPRNSRNDDYAIRVYDHVDDRQLELPDGVNTPAKEYHPTASGDWLMFGRWRFQTPDRDFLKLVWQVNLVNLSTGEERVLAEATGRDYNDPGQVNGDWAAWTECTRDGCTIHRFHIPTGQEDVQRADTYTSSNAHAAAVTKAGIVYFVADDQCGQGTEIYRYDGSRLDQLIFWYSGQFRRIRWMFAATNDIQETNVYFGLEKTDAFRRGCPILKADIYRMSDDYSASPSPAP